MPETTKAGSTIRVTVELIDAEGQPVRERPAVFRRFEFSGTISGRVAGSDIGNHVMALCRSIEADPAAYHRNSAEAP